MSPSGDKSTVGKTFCWTWQQFWRSKDVRRHWQQFWRSLGIQLASTWRPIGVLEARTGSTEAQERQY